jgi:hypothetical protein
VRKILVLAAFVLVMAPSGAASAQDSPVRDPFVPLVQPSPVATGDGTTVPTDPTVPVDPAPDPDEPLPNTGSPAITWVGLGYVLIAFGGGAVVLSKVLRPVHLTAR